LRAGGGSCYIGIFCKISAHNNQYDHTLDRQTPVAIAIETWLGGIVHFFQIVTEILANLAPIEIESCFWPW